ncbi:hypothetical protein Q5H91_06955 [Sphingomonas sp. KR1UV-12]|uniref:Uncharacterized protein n=1 Tax=Sphingomonas aurea TaxID=3063994 RepID=A0ABT9EJ24_9SPHN|nr:hypothetical protein [Sphingomonas sp. KR1UV-12]MDP1026944.1 hypothetical protein [Sphingomonas sp. KR1UV-12]
MPARTKIFFDGGLRPAGMEIAVVLRGRATILTDLGPGTSMTAEWLALLHAAELARMERLADAVLIGDAAAIVAQANGRVRTPPPHRDHLERLCRLLGAGPPLRIRAVRRSHNLAGIALDRLHL